MKQYRYVKSNAFTSGNSLGNPAACIFTGLEDLTPEQMQAIAAEHKGFVMEVVFCSQSEVADCKLTYYSSECEVEFCGHGTIATMYTMVKETPELIDKPVMNLSVGQIEDALTLPHGAVRKDLPIRIIDAGLRTLLVPITDFDTEISVYPNEQSLKTFCESNDIDIILVFSKQTADTSTFAHTRVFAPKFGYLEDPATGSGNIAFANYLLSEGLWKGEPIMIEQGGNNRVFNSVKLKCQDGKVLFGGKATKKIEGEYYI